MISKRNIFVICFLTCFTCLLHSQDIHFSQFYSCPLFTNAANTGKFEGDYRFVLNNKNQWNSFTNAYRTFATSFDYGFNDLFVKSSRSGLGLQLNNDISGDGRLATTQICLNTAYYFPFTEKLSLGLGTNIAYVFHSVDLDKFKFGNQYINEEYNQSGDSGESLYLDNNSYPDFGLGANLVYKLSPKVNLQSGFMLSHLFNPVKSFYNNQESFLPVKWSIIAMGEINMEANLWLEPHIIFMFQQKYREYNLGGIFRYEYNPLNLQALYFGGTIRTRDAGIVVLGFKYRNVKFLINYDVNLSRLSRISRGRGGSEFSIQYIFSRLKPIKSPYYRKCPDFL